MSITNHFISFHPIDLASDRINAVDIAQKEDVFVYVNDLVENIISANDQREYKFTRSTTEVCQAILNMVGQRACASHAQTVANRLLQTEKEAQRSVAHMQVAIQKGNLFHVVFKRNGVEMILIAKVDLNSFLDQTDFKKHAGLPFEKRILKTCLVVFAQQNEIAKITVSDTNNAKYWWKDFLELEEITSDEKNTKLAFNSIDHTLGVQLKRNFPSDYTYLRNNFIGYFRTQPRFSFDDFQRHVFGAYRPNDPNLDMQKLKSEIQKLPQKHKFDSAFNVVEDEIRGRIKRVILLTDKIKLELTDNVENLGSAVEAKQINGKKGIFIKSDDGYDAFHKAE